MRAKAARVFDQFETNLKPYKGARMKTAKTTKKLFVTAIALVTTVAIWATLGARRAEAFQGSETFLPYIETIGIASGQTARLNAINTNADRGTHITRGLRQRHWQDYGLHFPNPRQGRQSAAQPIYLEQR